MYKGKLRLNGGSNGKVLQNGVEHSRLEIIAFGETKEDVIEKVSKCLDGIRMIAPNCSADYERDVATIPELAKSKLENGFSFTLNYDDWDDIIAGATWGIGFAFDHVIVLQ